MAPKRPKVKTRDSSARRQPRSVAKQPGLIKRSFMGFFRLLFRSVLYLTPVIAVLLMGYGYYLDRTITKTFEGRRWSVPAQVYAQPFELYAGLSITQARFTAVLSSLGYRGQDDISTPGAYNIIGPRVDLHLRSFQFIEGARPAAKLQIVFDPTGIRSIRDNTGRPVPLIRLDPAVIGSFFPSHGEDRLILTPDQVPPLLAEGLKLIEDKDFDQHLGFSLQGILRALLVNLRSGERRQGGSTLTQQLVKSYYLTNERTIERKLREVAMAVVLELRFSKEDLLTAYINEIFLGQQGARAIHGFGLGAQFYFNKPISELDIDELATLISVIRGPSYYNPFRHPERALTRRNRILDTFFAEGLIDARMHRTAKQETLGVVSGPTSAGAFYPAFMEVVRQELTKRYATEQLRTQGLKVFTTIRPDLQDAAQAAVRKSLAQIERDRGIPNDTLQAAGVVSNPQTGEILAFVGSRNGRVDGFNRALNAQRPVGSVIKPLVVLAALENGFNLATTVLDEPITLTEPNGSTWSPKNFDGETSGPLPLVQALTRSLNLPMVHLGQNIGLNTIQERFTDLTGRGPSNPFPSFLLGAEEMSPLQLTELFSNFASGGFRTPSKAVIAVIDEQGLPLSHYPFELTQSIRPDIVERLTLGLELVMRRGTGRSSPFAAQGVAGKTGTSDDYRDSWFAGFDNQSLAVIWVGRDDNASTGLTGSSGALRVWNEITKYTGVDPLILPTTDSLTAVEFSTGLRANNRCADVVHLAIPNPDLLTAKRGCKIRKVRKSR